MISTLELYGIDPKTFKGKKYEDVLKMKYDAIPARTLELVNLRDASVTYDEYSIHNNMIKRLKEAGEWVNERLGEIQ